MKTKLWIVYGFSSLLLLCILLCTESVMDGVKNALLLCGQTVIPSLFPFFVLSSFMITTGFVSQLGSLFSPLAKRIFRISGRGAVVFVMGILCGYPTGAKMTTELYEEGMITKNEANRLLPFCNNSGPLFVIGAVGVGMLCSRKLGILLYGVHVAAAVVVGIVFSFFAKEETAKQPNTILGVRLGNAFSDSVCRGTKTMLEVCGYLVFFSVLQVLIKPVIICFFGQTALGDFISSFMEVTLGAKSLCEGSFSVSCLLILLSGVIGFGGVCVMLQVMGIVSRAGLSIKFYVTGKLMQMLLSMGIMSFITREWETVSAFYDFASVSKRYLSVSPYLLIAFFCACAYSAAMKRR